MSSRECLTSGTYVFRGSHMVPGLPGANHIYVQEFLPIIPHMSKTSLRRSKICPTVASLGPIYLKDFLPELTKSCPPSPLPHTPSPRLKHQPWPLHSTAASPTAFAYSQMSNPPPPSCRLMHHALQAANFSWEGGRCSGGSKGSSQGAEKEKMRKR